MRRAATWLTCLLLAAAAAAQDGDPLARAQQLLVEQQPRPAMPLLREEAERAEAAGEHRRAAAARNLAATASIMAGEPAAALEQAVLAAAAATRAGDPVMRAQAHLLTGHAYKGLRRYEPALEEFGRAAELLRGGGADGLLAGALNEQSNALLLLERPREALPLKREARRLAEAAGNGSTLASIEHDLALLELQLGAPERALPLLEDAHRRFRGLGAVRETVGSGLSLAGVLLDLGALQRARAATEEVLALAAEHGLADEEARALESLAEIASAAGDHAAAVGHLGRVLALRERQYDDAIARRVAELEQTHNAREREARIALLEREQAIQALRLERERSRRRLWFGASLALAAAVLAGGAGLRLLARTNRRLRAARASLEALSRTDPLTGLANRRHLLERLEEEATRSRRTGRPLALVLLDLDHFKAVNDRHGHEVGDRVLCAVARVLQTDRRRVDVVARWGGEEILLLLPETDLEGARRLAEHLRARIAGLTVPADGEVVAITATFGVAAGDGADPEADLAAADAALYAGKHAGRDRVVTAPGRGGRPAPAAVSP